MMSHARRTGPLAIVGVGNTDHGDDGIGPALVARLSGHCAHVCIDGGATPENVTGSLRRARPAAIMLVDAMELGLRPGEVCLLDPSELATTGFSTHTGSLELVSMYLEWETGAPVHVLGIQPERVEMGAGLSGSAKSTLEALSNFLLSDMAGSGGTEAASMPDQGRSNPTNTRQLI